MEENKTCKNCAYYSGALFVCFHPDNEGRRAFDNTPACGKHCEALTEEQRKEFYNNLFNNE